MLLAGVAPSLAHGTESSFETLDLELDQDRRLASRCRVVIPKGSFDEPVPLLVLLPGLGETKNEAGALDAWLSLYGAREAWQRLRARRVLRDGQTALSDGEALALKRSLSKRPFTGMVLVCPFMPNPHAFPGGARKMFSRYALWLEQALLPEVRRLVPGVGHSREAAGIAGVSLGGFAAVELGLRARASFGTIGTVQGAFGVERVPGIARRIIEREARSLRGVYVATSTLDPYRAANQRLYRELSAHGMPVHLSVRTGPHSQKWLREIGTLEMLLWHDRALRGEIEQGEVRPKRP